MGLSRQETFRHDKIREMSIITGFTFDAAQVL
jgi:hypothetical protein